MERYALLIANDTFPKSEGNLSPLTTVMDDHDGMKRILKKLRSPPFNIISALNKDAQEVEDALIGVIDLVNPEEDLMLIYYAGHGRILKNDPNTDSLLLATNSSKPVPDSRYRDFDFLKIEQRLKLRGVKRAVIILDCCYSGAAGNETENRGEDSQESVLTPFLSSDYSSVPATEGKEVVPNAMRDVGDGIYILTACAANQKAAGNTRTRRGEFTGHLITALEEARDTSSEPITLQTIFQRVSKRMKGVPQTPSLFKRAGDSRFLVIAPKGVAGERRKRSLEDWTRLPNDRQVRLQSMSPVYLLDSGFRFVDWNCVFEDVIARQLGLVIGCHAMEFVNKLDNFLAVTKRNPNYFPTPTEEEMEIAESTGEIWEKFPYVDTEQLEFRSSRFGLIVFKKLALQIHEPNFQRPTTWQIQLTVQFVQRENEYWENVRQVTQTENIWTTCAESYDALVEKYPPYIKFVNKVVDQVEGCLEVLEVGAGTGNTTLALLETECRTVTAIESNDAMLDRLSKKLKDRNKYARILKGDATTIVNRIYRERLDEKKVDLECFDACVMMDVLFALRDPGDCLKAIYKVLKPEAILSLSLTKMEAPVDQIMDHIREWQMKENRDEWKSTNEIAWGASKQNNLRLRELAIAGKYDLRTITQLILDAQFELVNDGPGEEYGNGVILLKARKPKFIQTSIPKVVVPPVAKDSPDVLKSDPSVPTSAGRSKIKLFVSYARKDDKLVEPFLNKLKELLQPSRRFEYQFFKDNMNVLVGEDWNQVILEAIEECDLGLLLVSPQFLSSKYIAGVELSRFIDNHEKPIVPVLLSKVEFDLQDTRGIESHQIFAMDNAGVRTAYQQCKGEKRNDFIHQLFRQLEERIAKLRDEKSGELH